MMTRFHTFVLVALAVAASGCASLGASSARASPPALDAVGFNLDHLDVLGEDVEHDGETVRLIHIYAEPGDDGRWIFVGDDDEGIACVDDAARAAVVYLRHFARTGDDASRQSAIKLLRFVRIMQAESGLFYNFVWDRDLRINTEHANSVADEVSWWTARAVWALGEGARVLAASDPAEAAAAAAAIHRVEPHLDTLLERYGETARLAPPISGRPPAGVIEGRLFPLWLIQETASDATSEMLLGLIALQEATPTTGRAQRIARFADGIARVRFGSVAEFPYGGFASWVGGWHGWGNSQTQALAEAVQLGFAAPQALERAEAEARSMYPRLLVDGWAHSIAYLTGEVQRFEQIAYDVRPAAVGLLRLYEATGDEDYAVMAGLSAAWFRGLNPAGAVMADPATGRGYDGILAPDRINPNAGAESTIEAQLTLLEVAAHPTAAAWVDASADDAQIREWDGRTVRSRRFSGPDLAVLVLDPEEDTSHLFVGAAAQQFLDTSVVVPPPPPSDTIRG